MPRPKKISDEAILAVARTCFRTHGHSVSTRDIAKEVGISQAVLYQRFGGKQQLFLRAMVPTPPNVEALVAAAPGVSARVYLEAVTQRLIVHFEEHIPVVMHLMTYPGFAPEMIGDAHEHLRAAPLIAALTQQIEPFVAAGEMAGPAEGTATAVLSLAHTMGMHAMMTPPLLRPEHVKSALDVLWSGVAP
ncbi:MAG: TetR/AcrR family transcriptional regulator [Myxococcota bacterium]